jgi:hypothetical protein
MKKLLITLLMTGVIAGSCYAQSMTPDTPHNKGSHWSIGVDAGLPTGDISIGYNAAIGGSIKFETPTSPVTFLTLSAGFEALMVKSAFKNEGFEASDNFIPLKAGLKIYLGDGFYAEGQAGVAFYTGSGGDTFFAYAPGIGYDFKNGLEIGARYEGWVKDGTIGQAALRVAFRFR